MSILGNLRCDPDDPAGLRRELERRDRIIDTLISQVERGFDLSSSQTLLQTTFVLEKLVRERTTELRNSVEEMEMFIRNAPAGIVFTRDHVILRYNPQFASLFGLQRDEGVGRSTRILFRSDQEFESALAIVDPILSASKTHSVDAFMRHRNGSDIWVHSIGYAVLDDKPGVSAVWMIEDRTAIKHAEEALRRSNAELESRSRELAQREMVLRNIFANAYNVYLSIDAQGIVTNWNRQAEIVYGWKAEEIIGTPLHEKCVPPEIMDDYFDNLRTGLWVNQRLELPSLRRDGTRFLAEVRVSLLEFEGERHFHTFLHDITERKALENLRQFEANHDALTGLPNRRGLMDALTFAIARAERSRRALAILFIDLDGFKAINDGHGHEIGDGVLREVARRLSQTLRQTDLVARLAGDEFIVVLENLEDVAGNVPPYAERLIETLSAPMQVAGHSVSVGASVGIQGFQPGTSHSAQELVRQADEAMYRAKKAGKGRYVMLDAPPPPADPQTDHRP